MKRASVLFAGVVAAIFLVCGAVLAQPSKAGGPPDRYIVVLEKEASDPGQASNEMARRYGLGIRSVYGHALEGFSATIPDGQLQRVRADKRVAFVEHDRTMRIAAQALPWGVNRVQADWSSTRAGDGSGAVSNVHAYVIDTGIDKAHLDLNVVDHVNCQTSTSTCQKSGKNYDCNGHGTHVAGTLAARDNAEDVVGVAPGAKLVGVKVLGCDGSGFESEIIKGIDWVTAKAQKPAVANLSLAPDFGSTSNALDRAIRTSAGHRILYSVAAGNLGKPACHYSPARAGRTRDSDGTWKKNNGVVTTAATNDNNGERWDSNYGSCVDLWAPGTNIPSTKLNGGTKTMSGTSMAAPHVGGGAALYLSTHTKAGSSGVEAALKDAARRPGTTSEDGRTILLENVGKF
jgi:aqualysin 1